MTLKDYLEEYSSDHKTTKTALQLWATLHDLWPSLREPDACFGPDGNAMLAWDDTCHHLELEVKGNEAEMFYLDRQTGYTVNFDNGKRIDFFQIMTVLGNTFRR